MARNTTTVNTPAVREKAKEDKEPSPQELAERQALELLRTLGDQATGEEDIVFEGKRLVLPATMRDIQEGIDFLEKRRDDEEQVYGFQRTYRYRPYDGAHAVDLALRKAFGQSAGKTIFTMFGPIRPTFIDVEISPGKMVQVPWNAMTIPGLDGVEIYIDETRDRQLGPLFFLHGEGPRKFRTEIEGFFNLVEDILKTESIYRGKAVDGQTIPHFLDLSGVNPESVVYTQDVLAQLDANVWSPIRHAETLAQLKLPGKRAVLFEGPYGTGKTLAAYLTAKTAVENGWTFFMVRPGRDDLGEVLQTAKMYQPSVVFFEDLDTVATAAAGDRDHMSEVLDLFDGIESKGLRMLLVLTTNNVKDLHPGMMRPGRLDAVISVGALDRPGVERLARYILGDALAGDVDFDLVFAANEGYMPAFVAEGLHRAIRYAVARSGGEVEASSITTEDLVLAAGGLRAQFDLMTGANAQPPADGVGAALERVLTGGVSELLEQVKIRPVGHPHGREELYIDGNGG